MDKKEEVIGIAEAAGFLHMKPAVLRKWMQLREDIPAHRIGRRWRFKRSELEEWASRIKKRCAPDIRAVEQYGIFECTIHRKPETPYPYGETELFVTFVSEHGSSVAFWGFYDGDAIWKIRFMPTELGMWHYCAHFSDDTETEFYGAFHCVPGEIPGMIGTDCQNPMWFGYSSGEHFFMRSFHVGDCFFADNWPDSSRTAFLDWAEQQGYNTLSIASFFINRQTYRRGMGWNTPSLWPIDPKEYRKAEKILDLLAQRKFIIFPFAGFFGREGFYPSAHRDQVRYIRYIIARWGCYWNLLFNVAGPEPLLDVNPYLTVAEIDKLGRLIAKNDIYHHALTVHNQMGDDQFGKKKYQSYTTLQGPKTTSLSELRRSLVANHPKTGPLYAQETLWTGNVYAHPPYTDTELRRNAYVIALSAAALNYGDMDGDSSSGFSGQPELARRVQRRHDIVKSVWDRVSRFPYYLMRPDDTVATQAYALTDETKQRCLLFVCQQTSIQLNLCEDAAYDAVLVRTDCVQPDIYMIVHKELKFPDIGDWLVYFQIRT